MKKLLTLLMLTLITGVGAWAEITLTGSETILTRDQLKATANGAHFAISPVSVNSNTSLKFYNGSGSMSTTLTKNYLCTLVPSGTDNVYYLQTGDGKYFKASSFGKTDDTNDRQGFTIEAGTSNDGTNNYSNQNGNWVKFMRNGASNWLNSQTGGGTYNTGPGGWTAFATFGPFYVATIEYQLNSSTVTSEELVVRAGENQISAPAGYTIVGSNTINVTADATFQIPVKVASPVVATMADLVSKGTNNGVTVSSDWEASAGDVYEFTRTAQDNGKYIGSITDEDLYAAFESDKVVTVAAWVYGQPESNSCLFSFGGQNTGIKYMLSGTTMSMTTKGVSDFASQTNTGLVANQWNLVAFALYGRASEVATSNARFYVGATGSNYWTKTVTVANKTFAVPSETDKKFAIGSGNQGNSRENFTTMVANLTIIKSDGLLSNSEIASFVGEAPVENISAPTDWVNYEDYTVDHKSSASLTSVKEGYYAILGIDQQGNNRYYLYDNGTQVKGKVWANETPDLVWYVKGNGAGKYSFRNFKSGKYLTIGQGNGQPLNMSATETNLNYLVQNGYAFIDDGTYGVDVASAGTDPTAWTGHGYTSQGSRRLMIYPVEILENTTPKYNVTYEVYYGDTKLYSEVKKQEVGSAAAYSLGEGYSYVNVSVPETTITSDQTIRVTTSHNNTLPFTIGQDYLVTLKGQYVWYNGTNFMCDGTARTRDNQDKFKFTVNGDWYNGFTLFNADADAYVTFGTNVSPADKTHSTAVATPNAGSYLDLGIKSGYNYFKLHGTTNDSYVNHRDGYFSTWTNSAAFGNDGSRLTFVPYEELNSYIITCTGLEEGVEGGVCYNRVNYTGEIAFDGTFVADALIAMHVSGYNGSVVKNDETKTITVNYSSASEETSTLWHGNLATDANKIMPASRIPAIITANNGDILAFSDWRYNFNDIGRGDMGGHIDIEMRRSTDGGQTWKPAIIAARGTGSGTTAGYGDAAVVADRTTGESQQVLLLAAAGSVSYTANNRSNSIRMAKFTSSNNGATWSEATDITSDIFAILPETVKGFFATSGKITQASFKADGATHNRIYSVLCTTTDGGSTNTNYVIYSDDFGSTWAVLGGTETPAMAGGNEAHVTELPGGDLLLDSRSGGRLVNLFTYSDKNTGAGTWGASGQKSITVGTACNGDIDVVDCYKAGTTEAVKVLIQSAPRASSRSNIRYYYKELPAQTEGHYTLADFVGGWTEGYQVCAGSSAYSSITSAGTGVEYMLYEKNTNGNTFNYDIEFEKHNISDITGGAYLDHATVPLTINYTLTDVNGATYQGSCTGVEGTAPVFTGAYGYTLTGEQWGEVVDNAVSYTATINFPFPVSSNDVNKWVNLIYLPNYDRYISYDGTNAKMRQAYKTSASNDPGTSKDQTNFIWSVIPVFDAENSSFGFKIYSKGANKYVSATGMAHQAQVALAAEGDVFQLVIPTSNPNASHKNDNKGVFVKQSGGNTFSICTESATSKDFLTFWNTSTSSHAGQNVAIVAAYDMQEYDALLAQVENTGSHVGQYSVDMEGAAEKVAECRDNRDDMTKYYEHIAVMQDMTSRFVLNMPQVGHFYRIKASSTNKKAYSGVTDDQEIYLTSEISTQNTGRAAFALTGGMNKEANTIFYYDENKTLIAYDKGVRAVNNSNFLQIGAVGAEGTIVTFEEIGRNTEAGAYRIEFNNGARSLYTQRASGNYYTDAAGANMSDPHYRYFLEEVESLPVLFKGVGHGYATIYSPVALDIPTEELPSAYDEYNVTVYTTSIEQNNALKVTAIEDGVIPANQGVILYFANGEETLVEGENVIVNFPVSTEIGSAISTLSGTYATINADANSYVFALQGGNAGFYKYQEGTTGTLAGFKAYYENTTSATRGFALDFGGVVTAISQLSTLNSNLSAIYDLAGRRVSAAQKGILIKNGNKVIR